jgi:hypothetical protein
MTVSSTTPGPALTDGTRLGVGASGVRYPKDWRAWRSVRRGRFGGADGDTSQQRLVSSWLRLALISWLCGALLQRLARAANDAAQELDLRRDELFG